MYEQQRLPHALLFFGPEGSGAEAAAIELARVLNCETGDWETCGTCSSCTAMHTLRHANVRFVFPLPSRDDEGSALDKMTDEEMREINAQIDEKAANPYHRIVIPKASGIKISSIRDIRKVTAFRASAKGRTVVIILEADRMNPAASNALLKTLEEPGGDVQLILTTSRKDALLPTILSRCQLVRFDTLHEREIRDALRVRSDAPADVIEAAAHLSSGNFALALELADSDTEIRRSDVLDYLRAVVSANPITLHDRIQQVVGKEDRQSVIRFLVAVSSWFRDVLALHEGAGDRLLNTDLRDSIERFAEHYPGTRCSDAVREIESVIEMIQKNVHLVNVLIVLSQRLRKCIVSTTPPAPLKGLS